MQRVRQRLRSSVLPARYTRAEDSCLESMAEINTQRRADLKKSAQLIEKLRLQQVQLEEELRQELHRNEQLQQQHAAMEQMDRDRMHPLLLAIRDKGPGQEQRAAGGESTTTESSAYRNFYPAPPGTMARLCQAMLNSRHNDDDDTGKQPCGGNGVA